MKKYEFIYPYDRETTIEHILKDTHKPVPWEYNEVIYAKVSKNKKRIKLYHGIKYRNTFMPIFELKLIEKSERETVAKGFWRWPLPTNIIYLFLGSFLVAGNYKETETLLIVIFAFILIWGSIGVFGTWLEIKRMKKIIEHLEKAQKEY